jgi:hypothetical protein
LPAHNTARVEPEALTRALTAIRAIRSGTAHGTEGRGGQVTFEVGGITILTSQEAFAKPLDTSGQLAPDGCLGQVNFVGCPKRSAHYR